MNRLKVFSVFFLPLLLVLETRGVLAECNAAITATTPTDDFILHDDGTAIHKKTGLMWMRCSTGYVWDNGNCIEFSNPMTVQDAAKTAESLTFAGHSDWRLPNKNELASIIEWQCSWPALNMTVFPDGNHGDGEYVSSSFMKPEGGYDVFYTVWVVDFSMGYIDTNTAFVKSPVEGGSGSNEFYSRFVRDSQ